MNIGPHLPHSLPGVSLSQATAEFAIPAGVCADKLSQLSAPLMLAEMSLQSSTSAASSTRTHMSGGIQSAFTPLTIDHPEIQHAVECFELKSVHSALQTARDIAPLPSPQFAAEKKAALTKSNQALQLIHEEASGRACHSGDDYFHAAESLKNIQHYDPTISTTMLQLYEKSAEKFTTNVEYAQDWNIKQAFFVRAEAAKSVEFSNEHPLNFLSDVIKAKCSRQAMPELGAHFSGHDTGVLKGGALALRTRDIVVEDGTIHKKDVLNFELSHFARSKLESNLGELFQMNEADWNEVKGAFPPGFEHFEFKNKDDFTYPGKDAGGNYSDEMGLTIPAKSYEIEFVGIGKMTVGADPAFGGLYNDVKVEIDSRLPPGEGLKKIQQMLTLLGLGPVMGTERSSDDERKLIALVFRTYFPAEALRIERSSNFYEQAVPDLIEAMEMATEGKTINELSFKEILAHYQDKENEACEKLELLPGKQVWALTDLSSQMNDIGVHGCMCGVGSIASAISMMQAGLLSSKLRSESDIGASGGASKLQDIQTGGDDKIFLRAINDINMKKDIGQSFPLAGEVQLLIDLDVVNRGALVYFKDQFGVTNESAGPDENGRERFGFYQNRQNVLDFSQYLGNPKVYDSHPDYKDPYFDETPNAAAQKADLNHGTHNEVCIGGGQISPDFIKGCVVQTPEDKTKLLGMLISKSVVKDGVVTFGVEKGGTEMIMGSRRMPIDDFIVVSNKFTPEMWQ